MPDTGRKKRILVVAKDDKDFFIGTVAFHFRKAGWQVNIATSLEEVKRAIINDPISLTIVDAPFPDVDRAVEFVKCRRKSSLTPVLQLMPSGGEAGWFSTFRFLGNEQLYQPYEVSDMLRLAQRELERSVDEKELGFQQEVYFKFPTEDRWVDKANEVAAKLFADTGLDATQQVQMCTAFREAVSNAAQHGNRHRRDRLVDVQYYLDPKRLTVTVTDMGKGFPWRDYLNPNRDAVEVRRERSAQGKLGGLGILLMCKCADKVEYNDAGNAITLTKFRQPTPTRQSQPAMRAATA